MKGVSCFLVKGTVQRDFDPQFFFIIRTSLGHSLTNGLKHFQIWFHFRRDIHIFKLKKLTAESSSAQYHIAMSQVLANFFLTQNGMILPGVMLLYFYSLQI